MRNIYRLLTISAALLLCLGARAQSGFQAKPVYISNVADTVLGRVYLVHQVGEGHTLYSIGRAYKTSFDKMLKDSPDNQVDIGEYIYIPYQEGMLPKGTVLKRFTDKKPWVVIYLERSGESDAVSFPPTATVSDKPEQTEPQSAAESATPPAHAAIEAASQDMLEIEHSSVGGMDDEMSEPYSDSVSITVEDTRRESVPEQLIEKEPQDTLDIALMLPLYGNRPDDRRAYVYLPFFEGASIAWLEQQSPDYFNTPDSTLSDSSDSTFFNESESVSLPETGPLSQAPGFRLKLYDLSLTPNVLQEILADPYLSEADAVMAAAFAKEFPLLDNYCAEHHIPLIHPLSERDSLAVFNPWFVQLCASHQTQLAAIAAFAGTRFGGHRILIISDTTDSERRKAEYLHLMLSDAAYRIFDAELEKELELYGDEENTEKTLIIPFYAKEITAVKTLLALRQSKGVSLLAPSVWLDYPTIELSYFLQNNLCVYSAFGRSTNSSAFKDFARNYYRVYKGLPNKMAYQGYLSLKWLINRLSADNTNFLLHNPAGDGYNPGPRQGMAGFENVMVRFLRLTPSGLEPVEF